MDIMSLVIWLVLGAVAGWLAGMIMKTGSGNICLLYTSPSPRDS